MIATTAPPGDTLDTEARATVSLLEKLRMEAKAQANVSEDVKEREFWRTRSREIHERARALRRQL